MSVSDPRLPWLVATNIQSVLIADESWQLLGFDGAPDPNRPPTREAAVREQAVYRELLIYSFDVVARCLRGRISDQEGPRVLSLALMSIARPEKEMDLSALFGFSAVTDLSEWLFSELSPLKSVDGEERVSMIVRRFHAALGGLKPKTVIGVADLEMYGPLKRLKSSLNEYLLSADAYPKVEDKPVVSASEVVCCPRCNERARVPCDMKLRIKCRGCGEQFMHGERRS